LVRAYSYIALAIFVPSWCVSCSYCSVLCSDPWWSAFNDCSAYGSALFYYCGAMFGIVSCLGLGGVSLEKN